MKKKIMLWFVFFVVFVHFFKDITQDILNIATPFDLLGNVNEDLTKLPEFLKLFFAFLGYFSFLVEFLLIILIPLRFFEKINQKSEKYIWFGIGFLVLYFVLVILLDPRILQR